ncbi:MAG: bifunctional metallophosphatase/5'-nucleotidase [Lactobacillaceae bacterium]|jgi:2',3'-cyclic-nucleotide 2'-phosphodiesterase/3'-nucleotidase|nr:bifunctional metallophosphatase/5'-nucleotidase [Lactobacillaceae bacterium]
MKIHVLSTSDVHGWILPDNFAGDHDAPFGLARATTAIKEFKKQHPNDVVFVVDNGDFIQGSPMTNFIAQSHPEYVGLYQKLADEVGYDVRTLGNHEFNYGFEYLKKAVGDDAKIVDANVFKDGELFYEKPYTIIERDGVKVGFLGLTTEFISNWERESNIPNMEFKNPVEIASQLVPEMRRNGAEYVVVMYHAGFEDDLNTGKPTEKLIGENRGYELLQTVPGIDALVTGHQHRIIDQLVSTPFGDVPTTQPGQKGAYVGVLSIDTETGARSADLLETKDYKPDAQVIETVSELQGQLDEYLDTVIGEFDKDYLYDDYLSARMNNHPIIDLINRIQGEAVGAEISGNALFNNEVPGFKKEVTRRDIVVNYLFPNTAVAEVITGKELLEALEQSAHYFELDENHQVMVNPHFIKPKVQHYNYDLFSGVNYTIDVSQPHEHRVSDVTVNGEPIDLNKEYKVAISNYRANGTGGYDVFDMDKAVEENPKDIAELLEDYLVANSPITLSEPNNIKVVNHK